MARVPADAVVEGDAFLLRRAVGNLIDNAVDFSPEGSEVRVSLQLLPGSAAIRVEDRGPGIPGYAQNHIFEKFYSLPRPRTGRKSTGLGLSFVQQIATHVLSENVEEPGVLRATWQQSIDSSRVWAKAIVTVDDPRIVAAGAVPWLLLEVVGRQRGPMGGAGFTQTTYIQRVATSGGVAPAASACATGTDLGTLAFVPYQTDYVFFRRSRR